MNRIFPDDVDAYFAGWRAAQHEQLELVTSGFAPVPVLTAPFFEQEVAGAAMLDRLGEELFAGRDPAAVLHPSLSRELEVDERGARLRLPLPFADKGDLSLKQIGLELVVRVDGQKRTVLLPAAMASFAASSARFEDGELVVTFEATA